MHRWLLALVLLAACGGKTAMPTNERATSDPVKTAEDQAGGGAGRGDVGASTPSCQIFGAGTYRWRATRTIGDDSCGPAELDTTVLIGDGTGGSEDGWSCHHTDVVGTCRDGIECEHMTDTVVTTRKTVIDTSGGAIDAQQRTRSVDAKTDKLLSDCAYDGTYEKL